MSRLCYPGEKSSRCALDKRLSGSQSLSGHQFFFSFLGGVRLSPPGTSATNCPIVPTPDDRWWVWSSWWNENWQGKPKYPEKTCLSATSSTTNPTWPDLGSKPGRRGGKPATNHLSYGTAPSRRCGEQTFCSCWESNPIPRSSSSQPNQYTEQAIPAPSNKSGRGNLIIIHLSRNLTIIIHVNQIQLCHFPLKQLTVQNLGTRRTQSAGRFPIQMDSFPLTHSSKKRTFN
jgi:hypothetical protein